jgi:hypothetical protein
MSANADSRARGVSDATASTRTIQNARARHEEFGQDRG